MPRRIVTNSFVSGEISPELYGRHDLKVYFNGAARLENFIVRRTGGIRKRTGTQVIHTYQFSDPRTYRIFPYYYDSTTYGLLLVGFATGGVPKWMLTMFNTDDSSGTTSDLTNIPFAPGIYPESGDADELDANFDNLRCKQVGDTLFFTYRGKQSFRCAIYKDDLLAEWHRIDNVVTVPPPNPITATPANFDIAESDAHTAMDKHYALFGVKDGIYSKPATDIASASTPWYQGATVTVTGILDFTKHDYYVLAKKSGMNWGKLSEIYPSEMDGHTQGTVSDIDAPELTDNGAYSLTEDDLFADRHSEMASDTRPHITPKALLLKTTEYEYLEETRYRTCMPHYRINLATPSQVKYWISMRPDLMRTDTLEPFQTSLKEKTIWAQPFYYSATAPHAITLLSIQELTTSANSGVGVEFGSLSGDIYVGVIVSSNLADMAQYIAVGGIAVTDLDNNHYTPTGYATALPDAGSYSETQIDICAMTSAMFVQPTGEDYYITSAWNHVDDLLDLCALSQEEYRRMWMRVRETVVLPASRDFSAYAIRASDISFTVPAGQETLSAITIHAGAIIRDVDDGSQVDGEDAEYIATLYHVDGATETPIASINLNSANVADRRAVVSYDTLTPGTTYKLDITGACTLRGITLSRLNTALNFVDDNIVPTSITGQQDMLVVGDINMDCGLFGIYQQRSVYASSEELPFTVWFSAAGDIHNFYANRPQADDDAFSVTIPATRASRIYHILAGKELLIFTQDGVYNATAENGSGLSYRTISLKRICDAPASATVEPILIDSKVLYVGEDGRTVYELAYNLMEDAITPTDRTVHAYHLSETAHIEKIVYQRFPDGIVWCLMSDGTLIAMTYLPEHEVWAWHKHTFAAVDDGRELVDIIDAGSVKTGSGIETTTEILLVFRKHYTVLDVDMWDTYIERMLPHYCIDKFDPVVGMQPSCLDHYGTASAVAISAKLVTLRPESPEVSTQGIPKRIVDVCLRLRRTGSISVKPYSDDIGAVVSESSADDGTLFTGDLKIMPNGYINGDGQMQIESKDNWPCEILSVVYTLDIPS